MNRPKEPPHDGPRVGQGPILGGVLIGGGSTRMGQPKSLLVHQGVSFVERVVTALRSVVDEVVLLGDGLLPDSSAPLRRLPDAAGLRGPLAGILAALRSDRQAGWIIAACDLPLLRTAAVVWLVQQRGPGRQAILPSVTADRVEPLLAVYEADALPLVEELVAEGRPAPHRLAGRAGVYSPTVPAELQPCWTNVNTPAELSRIERERDRQHREKNRSGTPDPPPTPP